jgi:hypothetical protein
MNHNIKYTLNIEDIKINIEDIKKSRQEIETIFDRGVCDNDWDNFIKLAKYNYDNINNSMDIIDWLKDTIDNNFVYLTLIRCQIQLYNNMIKIINIFLIE